MHGTDIQPRLVEMLNRGEMHFSEEGVDDLLQQGLSQKTFQANLVPGEAEVYVIAVPTPIDAERRPDLRFVFAAADSLAPYLKEGALILIESTSPVGTTEQVRDHLSRLRPDLSFAEYGGEGQPDQVSLAYCPERIIPGRMIVELVRNDRVVGGLDERSTELAMVFYGQFVEGDIFPTDSRTAEMCKLAENSFRDLNIAFANELSLICERLGIDPFHLITLANRHPRVNILKPGPGVGGHCIAVDPWFLVDAAPDQALLIQTARNVNDSMPGHVVRKIRSAASALESPVIACLGLAFKPDVEDLRESPALEVAHKVAEEKLGRLLVVEPFIDELPLGLSETGARLVADMEKAMAEANIVVMLVNHTAFSGIKPEWLKGKILIDTRGALREADPAKDQAILGSKPQAVTV
jgi:UDP-N-acetyl-D-mannosaminuronic acid dehydrogenase